MRVTSIEELTKSRSKVVVDEEFAFVLYKGELRTFHIREGEEIGQDCYQTIVNQLLPKRAKLRAMNLLKTKDYTVKQLRDKLRTGGYPEEVIDQALAYVESFRYTDDLRYAVGFISSHEGARSRRRIEQDLLAKGIDRATLEEAWVRWEEQGGSQDEQAMIRALLDKKHFDPQRADYRERRKMVGFLLRKGFAGEEVRKAVRFDDFYAED